ncbi:MAG: LamG domain-containing protein [Bacteroidales bacterium]|nr:LamG domain-containing protein [Bacteroidales bacterium]
MRLIISPFVLAALILAINVKISAQPLNNYLGFDGTNDYVDLGNSTTLKPTIAITVEVWAYNSDWVTFDNARFISNTQTGGYNIQAEGGNLTALVYLNGSYQSPHIAPSSLSSGWHHFALSCDGRYTKLYVDGVLEDTKDAGAVYPIQYAATSNSTLLAAKAGDPSRELFRWNT